MDCQFVEHRPPLRGGSGQKAWYITLLSTCKLYVCKLTFAINIWKQIQSQTNYMDNVKIITFTWKCKQFILRWENSNKIQPLFKMYEISRCMKFLRRWYCESTEVILKCNMLVSQGETEKSIDAVVSKRVLHRHKLVSTINQY